MKENVLYPVDYDETLEPPEPGKPATGRDEAAALTLIRAAVPKDSKPLPIAELIDLVCGRYVRHPETGELLPIDDAPDASLDLSGALTALRENKPLKGPAIFSSLLPDEVKALALQVIEERKGTWKPKPAAATVVEEKPKVEEKE
jgi:hypothetical protein